MLDLHLFFFLLWTRGLAIAFEGRVELRLDRFFLVPVSVENQSVSVAILVVGCLGIGRVEDGEKIREEIYEHAALYEAIPSRRKAHA